MSFNLSIISNLTHRSVVIGKAGRSRWLNIRPTVRGVAMNPVDHPHGGATSGVNFGLHLGAFKPNVKRLVKH